MRFLLLFSTILISASMGMAQTTWTAVPEESSVTFTIKNVGARVEGRFGAPEVSIKFDPKNPGSASFQGKVKANTIDTGIDMRDKHLKKEDYFHVEKFPEIAFRSSSVVKNDDGYWIKGKLSMKGTEREVTIPLVFSEEGDTGYFEGTVELDRRDYEVGGWSLTMADEVLVKIFITASRG